MYMPLSTSSYLIAHLPFRTHAFVLAGVRAPTFLPAALFEMHMTLWILAVAAGVAIALFGHFRSRKNILLAGGGILALALLWIASAILLNTPIERLYNAHAAMAAAARTGDTDALLRFVAPEFTLQGVTLNSQGEDSQRDMLAAEVRESKIREVHILHYDSALTSPSAARTDVTVLVTSDTLPPLTTWRVSWRDVPGADWQVIDATLTRLGNQDVPPSGIPAM